MIDLANLKIVDVEVLPWPNVPGQAGVFCWLNELSAKLMAPGQRWPTPGERMLANAARVQQLARDGCITECLYHQPDWFAAAATAIAVVTKRLAATDSEIAAELAVGSNDPLIGWTRSLLTGDAISWSPRFPEELANGQKRVCALKQQRVPKTVVRVT